MKKVLLAFALCLATVTSATGTGPADELIKLARSGVDGEVLLAYVESSSEPFGLSADDIIVLKDLGVPSNVISAALHRDLALDSIAAARGGKAASGPDGAGPESDGADQVVPPSGSLNISFFYDYLSPYGRWILIDGDWCWQPNAMLISVGWAPYYSRGRWVYTNWGWCWVSDYSWGWVPFHYGRWFRHHRHGWCWWPDNVWGPAWVAWRHGHGYWGWAPIPRHHHYRHGHGWYHHKRRLRHGHDFGLTWLDYFYLPTGRMADPKPWVHIVPPERGRDLFARTSFDPGGIGEQGGRIFNRGPLPDEVGRESGEPLKPLTIINRDLKPGQNIIGGRTTPNGLEIYTPKVTPDVPRPPVVTPPAGGQLPGVVKERRQEATRQALDRRRQEAEAAERERKALIEDSRSEGDERKRQELRIEAEVREQRAREARETMERIRQRESTPPAPVPQPARPQIREETREQVQSEAREEKQKRQAIEDLLRKPAPAGKQPAKDAEEGSGRKGGKR